MMDLKRPLQEHSFLRGIEDKHVEQLVGCTKNVRFQPGEFLMKEGDVASTFYLLRHGRVSLEVMTKQIIRVETAGPGDIVGLSWLLAIASHDEEQESNPRVHLDARALESVVALAIQGECLRQKMESDPSLGYSIMKRVWALTFTRLERTRLQRLDVYKSS